MRRRRWVRGARLSVVSVLVSDVAREAGKKASPMRRVASFEGSDRRCTYASVPFSPGW